MSDRPDPDEVMDDVQRRFGNGSHPMSDPIRRLPLEAAGRRATSADVREEIDNLEGFLRGLLIGQDRLRDA